MNWISQVILMIALGLNQVSSTQSEHCTNPFSISFPEKKNLTREDYLLLQQKLSEIPKEAIQSLLSISAPRAFVGANLGVINVEKNQLPIQSLIKIGTGGSRCIVSYASYNKRYPELLNAIPKALEDVGFNGYFFYRIGGFPNPTGKEIQYAGVPFCFKIFSMLEAQQLGFDTVLWLDAVEYPLKNPDPLFESIETNGYVLHGWEGDPKHNEVSISSNARNSLLELTKVDVVYGLYVQANVFGLHMSSAKAQEFIKWYYRCVELGTPFLSDFPEEYVIAALVTFLAPDWKPFPACIRYDGDGSLEDIQTQIKKGEFFFYNRQH